jgi:hypothetical protein
MALIETAPTRTVLPRRPVRIQPRDQVAEPARVARAKQPRLRPAGAPLGYRGSGVVLPRGPHRRRPVTPATTFALALLAALITVWLGLVAQFGAAVSGAAGPVPDRLAVVRVEPGETLQHLAARVAPEASAGEVAERIRELNGLDSPALTAGQTLISPAG